MSCSSGWWMNTDLRRVDSRTASLRSDAGAPSNAARQPLPAPFLNRKRREALTGYLLILPALLPFLWFVVGPLIGAVVLSFYSYNLLTPARFIGLGNYRFLVHDHIALTALSVTTTFTIASVVLHVVVGLALALAVNRKMPSIIRYLVRTAVFFPVLISWAVVSLIAEYTLDPNFGFIPYYLSKIGIHNVNWFTNPHDALPAIIGVDLWHSVGFSFIVLLAGLQVIPGHLYESAQIDGAGPFTDLSEHHAAVAVAVHLLRHCDLVHRRVCDLRAGPHHYQRRTWELDGDNRAVHLREGLYPTTHGVRRNAWFGRPRCSAAGNRRPVRSRPALGAQRGR